LGQALRYGEILNVPFVLSSNGDGFVFHDRTGTLPEIESTLSLAEFPPRNACGEFTAGRRASPRGGGGCPSGLFRRRERTRAPVLPAERHHRTTEAIAKGQNRVLLVMATGTGKTYTAFQIIWRLWKSGRKKRVLYLADRNVLIDQTMVNDFRPFKDAMTKLSTRRRPSRPSTGDPRRSRPAIDAARRVDKSHEIYLGLYQAITGPEERQKLYKQFSPGSSTSLLSTSVTAGALMPTRRGERSSTTSPPRRRSA